MRSDVPVFRPRLNYSLRPAKATTRRMIVETLARLEPITPLAQYRYVGMGSIYFGDFQLIHRRLGVEKMITIEGNRKADWRIRFNMPLANIDVLLEHTNQALPRVALDQAPHIVWLDYESPVIPSVLADIDEVVGRCAPSSVIIVTVNANRLEEDELDKWLNDLPVARRLHNRGELETKPQFTSLVYRLIRDHIGGALRARNSGAPIASQLHLRQMIHMLHRDKATMLTVGGAILTNAEVDRWPATGIDDLDFSRSGRQPFQVNVPFLTRREIQHLMSKMPGSIDAVVSAANEIGIPGREAKQFASIYRYAPLFVETEDW